MDGSQSSTDLGARTSVADFLQHFGVKGMKWGHRLARGPKEGPSADAQAAQAFRDRVKRSKVKALSNAELQQAINRMNLEQQFKRLSINEKNVATRFIANTLLEAGKREITTTVAKKAAKIATRAVT